MDLSFLVRLLDTPLWLRPLDVAILAGIWVLVLGRRVTRSIQAVIVVAAGEALWILVGVGGPGLADTARALLLFLVLVGALVVPWLLAGRDRADLRFHLDHAPPAGRSRSSTDSSCRRPPEARSSLTSRPRMGAPLLAASRLLPEPGAQS